MNNCTLCEITSPDVTHVNRYDGLFYCDDERDGACMYRFAIAMNHKFGISQIAQRSLICSALADYVDAPDYMRTLDPAA